ncbi:hypothetical protein Bccel_3934 [Pseudobacteroides cellulosolvens ATCC 35603 = DSM 2933]|uniref:Uncharacterized protein n=1 Tax=Pseudobacteroides cellulosolvens ATCC 35603 = DSM 2933 TaxID=398512 RepID=A0A0L6JSF5_9FIRM|nr:hypothetical protein Bccel_3934 [Pseudobacteroides cellulosolvens ATCC 35603 = DSM 2933]
MSTQGLFLFLENIKNIDFYVLIILIKIEVKWNTL